MLKLLSLFSGIGAFEKALRNLKAAYDLAAFSEIDKSAVKSYCAIHGVDEAKNLGDITKIDERQLAKDIDIVTYGFPCQDFSICGKKQGLLGPDGTPTRSGLFFDALRIIEATKPKIAIAENVKNLVSKKFNAQFQVILELLEHAGYNNYWKVLNAKDFGIPQSRPRVFLVSIRKDIDTGRFHFPPSIPLKKRLPDILENEVDEETKNYYGNKYLKTGALDKAIKMHMAQLDGDISICLTARAYASANTQYVTRADGTQTILSAKEAFRLMGFDDEDFNKAKALNSNSQIYKQAGNSIVVDVAERILSMMLDAEGNLYL